MAVHDSVPAIRLAALRAIPGGVGEEALARVSVSGSAEVRLEAAERLRDDLAAVRALLRLIGEEGDPIRARALDALPWGVSMRPAAEWAALLPDGSPRARRLAREALVRLPHCPE